MAPADGRMVHQALFGYADGHRLLESSIKLSSRDRYDLSAISDLASGIYLRPSESYLTGTFLQDSPLFALIRTWPAPEMPRPGCVWSHVLLLPPDIVASQRDFSVINACFARPKRVALKAYGLALDVSNETRRPTAHSLTVAQVMAAYYGGQPFVGGPFADEELDEAVLAVWSQQWPRLRAAFSFRTIGAVAGAKNGAGRFDFQPNQGASSRTESGEREFRGEHWLDAAAIDATSAGITPLRRFLWRYGRDLRNPRQRFENLVKIFLATSSLKEHRLPLPWAQSICGLFPSAEDASTLKRDMLGLERSPLALCPAVGDEDTLELLAALHGSGASVPPDSLKSRLLSTRQEAIPALAASYGNHASELADWRVPIETVITKLADVRVVADTRVPPALRLAILRQRIDLISESSLAAVGDEEVLELFGDIEDAMARTVVMRTLLRREAVQYPSSFIGTDASVFFDCAMAVRREGQLSYGAIALARRRARHLLSLGVLDSVAGSASAAEAADLLGYPVDDETGNDVRQWLATLRRPGAFAEGQSRTNLEAYLFIVAIRSADPYAWELLQLNFSHVQLVALDGGLINPAYDLLERHLPPNGWNSWDFNRRMLIGLRELRRRTAVSRSIVATLGLSEDDLDFVVEERKSKKKDKGGSSFWPWY